MHKLLTAKQIAKFTNKTRQAIEKRAKKEGWKYKEIKEGRGKPTKYYYFESLPSDIKSALEKCNQFTLKNATSTPKCKPEKFTLNKENATESVNQSVNLNQNIENKGSKNATIPENIAESVNLKNATDESLKNKGLENATKNATTKIKNATFKIENATNEKNATENATESVNLNNQKCNQTDGIPEWISLPELANLLDVSKVAVSKRANSENWEYREVPTKGGYQKQFKTESLPPDIFRKLILKLTDQYNDLPEEFIPRLSTKTLEELKEYMRLYTIAPQHHKEEAQAKLEIIEAYKRFEKRNSHLSEGQAKSLFVKLYNQGKITVYKALDVGIHQITLKSLYKWINDYDFYGLYGLLPKHINKGRKQKITPQMINIVWSQIGKGITRGTRIYETLKYYKQQGKIQDELPSYSTFSRWFSKWKSENDAKIKAILEPDKFRSEYLPAFGDQQEQYNATYYGQVLMIDATKADVMCRWKEVIDGKMVEKTKRLELSMMIDVYSRDVRFILAEKENSYTVVDGLFRKWLLEIGVPERIITDNGKVYTSTHFKQVCERFNVELIYAQAYSPEQKAFIERAFSTIATQFFETIEGYIGHSVAERKAIESRKKWATKIWKDENFQIEILLSPEQLTKKLEEYLEKRYRKEKHSFGVVKELIAKSPKLPPKIKDERILDILLGKETRRKLTKKGIRINNTYYVSQELLDYLWQTGKESFVLVREDVSDVRRVYVYDLKGKFICEAFNINKLEPKEKAEIANKAKNLFLKNARAERKQIKKLSKEHSESPYEIMITGWQEPKQDSQPSKVVQFPRPQQEFENEETKVAKKLAEEQQERETLAKEELQNYTSALQRAFELFDLIREGQPITAEDYEFLKEYSKTEEFKEHKDMGVFDDLETLEIKIA